LSNDVEALAVGQSCPALLLDDKGRIQAGMTVARDGEEAFTLVLDDAASHEVAHTLAGFHFSEDLEIIGPENAWRIVASRPIPNAHVDIEIHPRIPDTYEAIVGDLPLLLSSAPLVALSSDLFSMLRVEAGVPRIGVDTNTRTLVQEAGLEEVTVSFSKGCYLGQETVARVAHRGGVKRRLRGLTSATKLSAGADVTSGSATLGTITSATESPRYGHLGLAILRDRVDVGDEVQVGDATAEVARLPFGS